MHVRQNAIEEASPVVVAQVHRRPQTQVQAGPVPRSGRNAINEVTHRLGGADGYRHGRPCIERNRRGAVVAVEGRAAAQLKILRVGRIFCIGSDHEFNGVPAPLAPQHRRPLAPKRPARAQVHPGAEGVVAGGRRSQGQADVVIAAIKTEGVTRGVVLRPRRW